MTTLAQRGADLLGGRLSRAEALGGGNLSSLVAITLADGREAIVKDGPDPSAEAAMLRGMRAAGVSAPEVYAVDSGALVMERLPADGDAPDEAGLGRTVARLHIATGGAYGWDRDYAFGRVGIANGRSEDWCLFWAERRLLCHGPHIDAALARRLEALAGRLPDWLPRRPRAVLLHGDLWGGNIVAARGRVTGLIDPACYYGHAEVDLAMLALFGRIGPAFREAYGPAEAGFAERVPLYQLWPALVHLRLFGEGYRATVEDLLARCDG